MKAGKNQQVVLRLADAVSANDKDRIQSFFAEDSILRTFAGDQVSGKSAIWGVISDFHNQAEQVDWHIETLREDDTGKVLTEGQVRYLIDGQWHEFEVKGAFEVKGSKIAQWH